MKNKTYMLPWRFRKCGYGLIIASVLSSVLGLLMANVFEIIPQTHTRFISMVMYILFFLGITNLLMSFLHGFRNLYSMPFISSMVTILTGNGIRYGLRSIDTYIIIYLIIFRISIWNMRRQCREDAE